MRIGIDAAKVLPPRDGLGNYSAELISGLMRQDSEHEFLLYGLSNTQDCARFATHFPDCPPHFLLSEELEPSAEAQLDLFHSLALGFPQTYEGRSVFTCPDMTILTHSEFHTVENKVHCMTGVLRALYRGAHFLAISSATAQALQETLKVEDERVTVVLCGRSEHFKPLPRDEIQPVLTRFGLDRPFVLSVGTQEPRKNLLRLLKAYGDLPDELRRHYPLVICGGQGWRYEETEAYLQRPEMADVRRLGRVSDEELVALYNAATLFTFPSLAEGFGLPVLEAMACGAPVITSNVTSLPEVAGDAARLVDPRSTESIHQALLDLLAQPQERQRMTELGFEQASRFSWDRAARETMALYDRLLSV